MEELRLDSKAAAQVACGGGSTFYRDATGSISACGYNDYGQLGLGDNADRDALCPIEVSTVADVASGACHTFLLLGGWNACRHRSQLQRTVRSG